MQLDTARLNARTTAAITGGRAHHVPYDSACDDLCTRAAEELVGATNGSGAAQAIERASEVLACEGGWGPR